MDEDLEGLTDEPAVARGRLPWGTIVGAGFGLALGAVWAAGGFRALVAATVLACLGGFLGRIYLRENGEPY
jgi:hypothetical protein